MIRSWEPSGGRPRRTSAGPHRAGRPRGGRGVAPAGVSASTASTPHQCFEPGVAQPRWRRHRRRGGAPGPAARGMPRRRPRARVAGTTTSPSAVGRAGASPSRLTIRQRCQGRRMPRDRYRWGHRAASRSTAWRARARAPPGPGLRDPGRSFSVAAGGPSTRPPPVSQPRYVELRHPRQAGRRREADPLGEPGRGHRLHARRTDEHGVGLRPSRPGGRRGHHTGSVAAGGTSAAGRSPAGAYRAPRDGAAERVEEQ